MAVSVRPLAFVWINDFNSVLSRPIEEPGFVVIYAVAGKRSTACRVTRDDGAARFLFKFRRILLEEQSVSSRGDATANSDCFPFSVFHRATDLSTRPERPRRKFRDSQPKAFPI